jgi:hypothetical protein
MVAFIIVASQSDSEKFESGLLARKLRAESAVPCQYNHTA